jgi:hypothetical protein
LPAQAPARGPQQEIPSSLTLLDWSAPDRRAGGPTYNGVTLSGTVTVGSHTLVLNGLALRKKSVFKVYVGGLYLAAKSSDADAVLAADAPRRMVMQFLRDVGKDKMCDAWDEALANNTPNASAQLKAEFVTLCGYMEDIKKEQQFVFTTCRGPAPRSASLARRRVPSRGRTSPTRCSRRGSARSRARARDSRRT